MATKIVTKNSSTASAVPTASDLVQGELAVNVADKRLFTEDNGGNIVELGTNPTTLIVDTTTLVVDSTNNRVGVGTASPTELLHVTGATDPKILVKATGTGDADADIVLDANDEGESGVLFHNAGTQKARLDWSNQNSQLNLATESGTDGTIDFQPNDTLAMRILADGKVGIGTGTPSAPLHAKSSGELARLETTSSGGNNYLAFYKPSDARKGFIGYGGGSSDDKLYINNDENADILFRPNNSEAMRILADGKVGIGTASPAVQLHVQNSASTSEVLRLGSSTVTHDTGIYMRSTGTSKISWGSGGNLAFYGGGAGTTERMRIDSTGKVGIGTASPSSLLTISGAEGSMIQLQESGTDRGAIGIKSNEPFIVDTVAGLRMSGGGTANILPCDSAGNATNQALNLGASTLSFDTVFADDFTNTSDRNYKQDIEELSEAELRVATACKGLMKKYRMKHAVVKKGDDARIHVGIIAQDLRDAFTAEGLDAGRYGMFVSETVWEDFVEVPAVEAVDAVYETQTDEEGNETQVLISEAIEAADAYIDVNHYWTEEEAPDTATARTKMGVRYSQLLAFIISAL